MKYVEINARREVYSPLDVDATLTVSELIEALEGYDGDMPVVLSHDGGFSFGGIRGRDVREAEEEDEEEDEE